MSNTSHAKLVLVNLLVHYENMNTISCFCGIIKLVAARKFCWAIAAIKLLRFMFTGLYKTRFGFNVSRWTVINYSVCLNAAETIESCKHGCHVMSMGVRNLVQSNKSCRALLQSPTT